MKRNITNWIAILISVSPLVYLAIIWNKIPQIVPVHYGINMQPDRMGDKSELGVVAGILMVVSLFVFFLFKNLHRFDPKRKEHPPSSTFTKLGFGLVIFLAALSILIIDSGRNNNSSPNLMFPLIGFLFAFIGNYMINIKPNYFAGFRVPWTLNNDENWRKTHQLGGKLWFLGGLVIAVVCLFLSPQAGFLFFLFVTAILVIVPVVYSYRLFKNRRAILE